MPTSMTTGTSGVAGVFCWRGCWPVAGTVVAGLHSPSTGLVPGGHCCANAGSTPREPEPRVIAAAIRKLPLAPISVLPNREVTGFADIRLGTANHASWGCKSERLSSPKFMPIFPLWSIRLLAKSQEEYRAPPRADTRQCTKTLLSCQAASEAKMRFRDVCVGRSWHFHAPSKMVARAPLHVIRSREKRELIGHAYLRSRCLKIIVRTQRAAAGAAARSR